MALTKKLEQELRQVYLEYWDSYFTGKVRQFGSLLDDDYKLIGTSEIEIINNKHEAITWFKNSVKEIKGKSEFRNRKIKISSLNDLVLVTDLSDVYILVNGEWKFYSRIRISTILRQTENKWKVVQQHGSLPDSRTNEGETVSFETISKENLELRDAVKRRTIELENKTRELEIESALERVRTVAMGMKKPDDMLNICKTISTQMAQLGVKEIRNVQTAIFYEDRGTYMNYEYYTKHDKAFVTDVNYKTHQVQRTFARKMMRGDNEQVSFKGKKLLDWYEYQKTTNQFADKYLLKAHSLNYYWFSLGPVALGLSTYYPITPEETDLFQRFLKVFELAYRRYLDIENAEAQAREAQIQLALERVRARTMAMQKSDELPEAANLLFNQVQALGMPAWSAGYCTWNEDRSAVDLWMSSEGVMQPPFTAPTTEDELFIEMRKGYDQGKTLHVVEMGGKKLAKHYKYMRTLPVVGEILESIIAAGFPLPTFQIMHQAYFSKGFLLFITYKPVPESHEIFIRFAKVFDQTYTRFLDLKKSEFQTHQAKIETALEKVRARALAMQQPEELTEVAQVMRYEMGLLGVEELETSSIYIHEEQSDQAECWYAIKDIRVPDKKLVADHFVLNLHDTWVGRQMFEFYQSSDKQISIPMQGANRKEWINYCSERSKLLDGFYGDVIPERIYHLYKFSNGTIGAATPGNISADSWDLLQRAASVFSLAYSRFKDLTQARNDLQRLKEEKQRAETALADLQTTQKQLIQAEKMASLGELTAGIAHEIQNPLNFVNNFAEVNTELNAEGREAISSGNLGDAEEILRMLADNNDKILHHGKRADAIVKGMLQHSQKGSGAKESTNINALADEYLRLAYHGLKAKDRSFNATIKTDFDESIGNINIIPQDIGRVLLNLINNAFYAVDEKKKQIGDGYEPEVIVTTKLGNNQKNEPISQLANELIISVTDNGYGIPEKIRNKIFQPFFTTKPTGQGTGLGLSLSYDIVKAHGGELEVETKEGEGSTFIITLPA